ncbi:hypothetical protein HO133_002757 [Letharia lupina]|uniref:Uncharacterized protein n=1 Tax=Letharia lupina TaxID=560253 RepID=A0A8H6FAM3_9LECA|nr:uncharacterized protein HO133_002757 [Letharia lupina]KAF6221076.1 hypothetical protein HO133_002757 [Letharia lupina]
MMFMAAILTAGAIIAPINSLHTPSMVGLNQSLNAGPGEVANLTNINHFIVENCGDRTFDIYETVAQTRMLAKSALADARLEGTDSDFGYQAMFKEDEAQKAVVSILDHIYNSRGKANLRPRPDTFSSPRLSCVTEDSAKLYGYLNLGYDPWHRCLVGGPRSTPIHAFYADGTIYTFLCPAVFVQPRMSTRNHCPSVTGNRFSGDSGIFYGIYQTYIMLYQLIRFYLGDNALTNNTDPKEQLDWNDCVHLNTLNSVLNPTNLQIYIALVSQQCTSWPNPFAPPFYPLDLLSLTLSLIRSPLSSIPRNTLLQPISTQT